MRQDDFVSVSDIHVRSHSDPNYQTLLNFFDHPSVIDTEYLFLLGDIFDVLVGDYDEYLEEYPEFFNRLNEELNRGKKIIWIEGNHDFHFFDLLKKSLSKNNLNRIQYCKEKVEIRKCGLRYHLSHGDELEYKNPNYLKYRKFMRSHLAKTIINYFIPYKKAMKLKDKMQKNSRRLQADFDEQNSRDQFREYGEFVKSQGFDRVILGHSHILDEIDGYFNNGYFPNTKKFILDKEGLTQFVDLV